MISNKQTITKVNEPPKPWSISTFEQERPDLTQFVRVKMLQLIDSKICRCIVVRAPVKSGKREIVEYTAMRDLEAENPKRVHAFISAWHRTADEDQRNELKIHNMEVFSITSTKAVSQFHNWLEKNKKKNIILHFDECDYGSGEKQTLSKVWASVRNSQNIIKILYSATPEEVLYSEEVETEEYHCLNEDINEGEHVNYTPPDGYCGPARFLKEKLVHEAIPFFYKNEHNFVLSEQGSNIVKDLKKSLETDPTRNIIVLRLSCSDKGNKKDNKSIYQFLKNIDCFPELDDFSIIVDKSENMDGIKNQKIVMEKIQWSNPFYWKQKSFHPTLVIIDQTSSRSTEWACHNRVNATHDFRHKVQYGTVSQAQERVNHYEKRYGGFQHIHVYGHTRTFQLSARSITYQEFIINPWKKKKIEIENVKKYLILSTANDTLHPRCPEKGMEIVDAERLLQTLGCADMSISSRIKGAVRSVGLFKTDWQKTNMEEWDNFWAKYSRNPDNQMTTSTKTKNPFKTAQLFKIGEEWKGYHRGWKVLDYDRDIVPAPGWGTNPNGGSNRIKVCYRGGVLGVAIVRYVGTGLMNTLKTTNSMYKGK
jgi:hypothetical protein